MGRRSCENAKVTKSRVVQRRAGLLCLLGAAGVLVFVMYGFFGQAGPVGLRGLWAEPWFLITMADLYLGVIMALVFLWSCSGGILAKIGWSILFVIGGHPGVAIWLGVQLLTGRFQMSPAPTRSPGT